MNIQKARFVFFSSEIFQDPHSAFVNSYKCDSLKKGLKFTRNEDDI
jgi:hypothetical protein